ncbi:MAG: sulfotransferase family protein [Flavobacteriales bacterium]|nr:sulfotransferase family protein [Flavobacteriales bacterium]
MYSFAQREDTQVYDEPLYAHYLSQTSAKEYHPGTAEILESQENDGEKVIQSMLSNKIAPVQFYKQMTHHLLNLNRDFLKQVNNILLTRDPKEMLPSYAKVIDKPTIDDVGYRLHCELVDYFELHQIPFTVIDSKSVLLNPKQQLQQLCQNLDMPFDENMLHWQKAARPEDGVWAKYWYKNIHNSTGFMNYNPKTEAFPEHLKPLLEECMPYYEQLKRLAI